MHVSIGQTKHYAVFMSQKKHSMIGPNSECFLNWAVSHQCSVSVICADCTVVAGKYFWFSDANHLEHPQDRPERLQGEACPNNPLVASALSPVRPVFRNAVCLCCALASSVVWLRQCLKFMSRNQPYWCKLSTRLAHKESSVRSLAINRHNKMNDTVSY